MKCKYKTVMKRRITLRLTENLFNVVEHYSSKAGTCNTDTVREMIRYYCTERVLHEAAGEQNET